MPLQIEGETYYNASEAIKYLGVSRDTFYQRLREKPIPRYEQGLLKRVYYRQSDLDQIQTMRRIDEDKE